MVRPSGSPPGLCLPRGSPFFLGTPPFVSTAPLETEGGSDFMLPPPLPFIRDRGGGVGVVVPPSFSGTRNPGPPEGAVGRGGQRRPHCGNARQPWARKGGGVGSTRRGDPETRTRRSGERASPSTNTNHSGSECLGLAVRFLRISSTGGPGGRPEVVPEGGRRWCRRGRCVGV